MSSATATQQDQPATLAPTPKPLSPAKLAANRANSLKSTGPTSPQGKRIVSQNAATHGFAAARPPREVLLIDPDLATLHAEFEKEFRPVTPAMHDLVDELTHLSARLKLLRHAEFQILNSPSPQSQAQSSDAQSPPHEPPPFDVGCSMFDVQCSPSSPPQDSALTTQHSPPQPTPPTQTTPNTEPPPPFDVGRSMFDVQCSPSSPTKHSPPPPPTPRFPTPEEQQAYRFAYSNPAAIAVAQHLLSPTPTGLTRVWDYQRRAEARYHRIVHQLTLLRKQAAQFRHDDLEELRQETIYRERQQRTRAPRDETDPPDSNGGAGILACPDPASDPQVPTTPAPNINGGAGILACPDSASDPQATPTQPCQTPPIPATPQAPAQNKPTAPTPHTRPPTPDTHGNCI